MEEKKDISPETAEESLDSLFLRLFMAHQKSFYAFILALVHNYADAEDIIQETSAVMWHKFKEFEQGTDFVAWGITIARYQVLKFFKDRSRSRVQFNDELLKIVSDTTVSKLPEMEDRLKALRHCRAKLKEQDRNLLEMRYDHGISIKKMAESKGSSLHALYKKISRIQYALLRCIDSVLSRKPVTE